MLRATHELHDSPFDLSGFKRGWAICKKNDQYL